MFPHSYGVVEHAIDEQLISQYFPLEKLFNQLTQS